MFKAIKELFNKETSPYINAGDYFDHYEFEGPGIDKALEWADSGQVVSLAMAEYPENYVFYDKYLNSPYIKKGCGYNRVGVRDQVDFSNFEDHLKACDFVGAIGINGHGKTEEELKEQEEVFTRLLTTALDLNKKALITDFMSGDRILTIMRSHQAEGHLVQTDQLDKISDYLELGSYILVNPSIFVYEDHAQALTKIPADRILTSVESYQALAWAGIFEPSPVALDQLLEKISQVKGFDKGQLKDQVYENYLRLGI